MRNTRLYRFETLNAAEEELFYSFTGLGYGEYVLILSHDKNKNHAHDLDSEGLFPIEGVFVLNIEKLDPSLNLKDFTFDNLKFSFTEPERTIEAQMLYPPFTAP